MFFTAVVLIVIFVALTFLGYAFHWMFHQKWSKRFYRAHMNHHLKQYPVSNFYSDKYRDAGKDNTVVLFGLIFSPLVFLALILTVFGYINLFLGIAILLEMAVIGFLNNSLHDSFHLKKTFWHRFSFFDKLVKLHYNHHIKMKTNFGIFSFVWDRLFGTFFDIKKIQ